MDNETNSNENKTTPQTTNAPTVDAKSTNAAPTTSAKTNTMAIAAIITTFLFPLVGLILGIIALKQIKQSKEAGRGLALTAVILSSIWVALIALAIIMIGIFGFAVNKAANDAGVSVNTNTGTVTVNKDGNSAQIGESVKLPDGFPSIMPIYSGAKLSAASKTNGSDYAITASTTDSVEKVVSYYKTQLVSNGWTIDSSTDSSDTTGKGTLITASTSTLNGSVGIYGGNDGKTSLIINVYPKSN